MLRKEDFYNKSFYCEDEDFIKFQNLLFDLGFKWLTSGKKLINRGGSKNSKYITCLQTYDRKIDIVVQYNQDIILLNNEENYENINLKNFIRLNKIKKILE